jgi:hypothetical protein
MCHLGLIAKGQAPDAATFTEYVHLFVVGLSDEHCRAIGLFGLCSGVGGERTSTHASLRTTSSWP